MGFALKHSKGMSIPVVTCDTCGEIIEDWSSAFVFFPPMQDETIQTDIKICHKHSRCAPSLDSSHPMTIDLCRYLPWLLANNNWTKAPYGDSVRELVIEIPKKSL